jgi:enoyl-CoA hydratase
MSALALDAETQLEFAGHVAYVRLNRPDALNAFSSALVKSLAMALDLIDSHEDCRVIVVTGNGRAFSAGGDLTEFRHRLTNNGHDDLSVFVAFVARTLTRLERNPRPVIGAVGGVAVAGGLELLLCCDIILAARGVEIGDGHLRYGVLPGGGGVTRLIRKLPLNIAAQLLLTGVRMPAEYLQQHGLVNEVVDAAELSKRADDLASHIARQSPAAVRQMKRLIREAGTRTVADGLRLELEAFSQHITTSDFAEGIAAFSERRQPVYQPLTEHGEQG